MIILILETSLHKKRGKIGQKLNRFSKDRRNALASYIGDDPLLLEPCREQRGGQCPPIVITFSAVSTDRFLAFFKSLGVVTSEGQSEHLDSSDCIYAGVEQQSGRQDINYFYGMAFYFYVRKIFPVDRTDSLVYND